MNWNKKVIVDIAKRALVEDLGCGDITSRAIVPAGLRIEAAIFSRSRGIICGLGLARLIFHLVDKQVIFKTNFKDGQLVEKDSRVAILRGPARSLLAAERTALNFLSHLSGIATETRGFVNKIRPYNAKIMDTRKTTPGLRILEKYAVKTGGGFNHRLGLFEQVLIKDNHLKSLEIDHRGSWPEGPIKEAVRLARRNWAKSKIIEVEVKTLAEFKKALEVGADIIMLDNMNLGQIKQAVALRDASKKKPRLEVSGGVSPRNVRKIAATGVEMISVGFLTHSSHALDFSMEVIK
jgi:nicotinate-nucleotide pyrophosphorylase (carboxylating)